MNQIILLSIIFGIIGILILPAYLSYLNKLKRTDLKNLHVNSQGGFGMKSKYLFKDKERFFKISKETRQTIRSHRSFLERKKRGFKKK